MCIYLLNQPGLHYTSAEHVIPAGLGGIQTLPLDYVSQEFNNLSSKQELALMRNSILALPRQLLGPGKRGSLSPAKATRSAVNVFSKHPEAEEHSLGYIQAGKPYEIPHIVWDALSDEVVFSIDKESADAEIAIFRQQLAAFDASRVRLIPHNRLDATTFLLGLHHDGGKNSEFIVASRSGDVQPFTNDIIAQLIELLPEKGAFTGGPSYHVRTHQKATIGDEYYRCCAKIAFNTLAYLKGADFVLQQCFHPLRNWIVNGGTNAFVDPRPGVEANLKPLFPQDSHHVLIKEDGMGLVAYVCFYNHFTNQVRLTDQAPERFPLDGFVCDWQAKKESKLHPFLAQHQQWL